MKNKINSKVQFLENLDLLLAILRVFSIPIAFSLMIFLPQYQKSIVCIWFIFSVIALAFTSIIDLVKNKLLRAINDSYKEEIINDSNNG